ncbi:cupredoxin domain-containing protein [Cohnella cholangitidis]|uniref:Cytochrome C oxidase subunit II n=1 Tax=Cohnella cholangitidis TaxID=2598458 RepID=A0A7G5BUX9_9BACL|nr:cupredoxin domain-containing protein [Cohnella cholangitidis]QMV40763.1 cytochrome C oxidase subunit II [Cohnella cholangitidis]
MKKWMALSGLLLAAMLIASGCGGKNNKEEASSSPAAAGGGAAKAITIDATNFKFDQEEIKVKKGEEVSITLKNSQGNHAIKIEGYDKEIKGNATVTFVADKAGEFKYICSIFCGKGHNDMVGKLIVE